MKKVDWKIIVITVLIIWSPMIVGAIVYKDMPEMVASHFNIYGQPDAYLNKWMILFGLPIVMSFFQIFCCYINDIRNVNALQKPKVEYIFKCIIPVLNFVVYFLCIGYTLGIHYDMRLVMMTLMGCIFLLIGNYLPKTSGTYKTNVSLIKKFENLKWYNYNPALRQKMYRIQGITFVIFGFLFILSVLVPAVYSVSVVILMIIVMLGETMYFVRIIYKEV